MAQIPTMRSDKTAALRRYDEIVTHITNLIDVGTFRAGDRLPSVRHLAKQRHLAVGTVLHAYRLLEDAGRIEARPQSGYYVRVTRTPMLEARAPVKLGRAGRPTVGEMVMRMGEIAGVPGVVPLGHAVPSADCLPTRQLNRYSAAIARTSAVGMNSYDVPPGCRELRVQVARHYADAGCAFSPDDIVTTCGCQEALGLCLRAVAKPGSVIAIDTPSYFGQLQMIELLGLKALEIPTDPQTGVDLKSVTRAIKTKKVAACLFTTNCHNPLGFVMPEAKKRELVELLAKGDIPLIEDDIYGDLCFEAQRPTVCQAFDRAGRVLLCSSFSKTLAPGARVGWCAPGRYLDVVRRLKFCTTIATPTLPQLAIAEFLAVGGYAHHLRKLRKRYSEQLQFVSDAVCEYFPAGTRATRPAGGHVLWVELPEYVDSVRLFEKCAALKISIAPGTIFSSTGQYRNFIRLNCSHTPTPALRRAIETIGHLAARQQENPALAG